MFPTQSQIGRYCSIASDISFMSAQHPLDRFTTSSVMISGTSVSDSFGFSDACQIGGFKQVPYDQQMNDGIILGNDVWLGQEVLFKKNIKVGDGAVVGARSIVTKDVPPYAIVAGSPAKIIRYRYPFKIIEQLLILKWWNYPVWKFSSITADEQIESFIDKLQHKIITGEISEYHPEIVTAEDMSNYTD
ncbi:CatB-related O-acetyltransferase [Enterococcus sp. ALS3]|uniref:CatB-related O-acetyltransferase n=2 Tax=Enterococcus TaxID=1350 RepID=A0ABS6TF78_9ENTE|nr:CatB-related O-acetyltransferase [Enterococcus alishanensis]